MIRQRMGRQQRAEQLTAGRQLAWQRIYGQRMH
jgi:hypothetical protein